MTQNRFNKCPLVIKFHVGGGRNIRQGKHQMSAFSCIFVYTCKQSNIMCSCCVLPHGNSLVGIHYRNFLNNVFFCFQSII